MARDRRGEGSMRLTVVPGPSRTWVIRSCRAPRRALRSRRADRPRTHPAALTGQPVGQHRRARHCRPYPGARRSGRGACGQATASFVGEAVVITLPAKLGRHIALGLGVGVRCGILCQFDQRIARCGIVGVSRLLQLSRNTEIVLPAWDLPGGSARNKDGHEPTGCDRCIPGHKGCE